MKMGPATTSVMLMTVAGVVLAGVCSAAAAGSRRCTHHVMEDRPGYGAQPLWKEPTSPSKVEEQENAGPRRMGAKQATFNPWFTVYNHFGTCQTASQDGSSSTTSSVSGRTYDCGVCNYAGQPVQTWQGTARTCTESDVLTRNKAFLATKIVEEAINFLHSTLEIVDNPSSSPISARNDACGSGPGLTLTSLRPWLTTAEMQCYNTGIWQAQGTTVTQSAQLPTRRNIVLAVTYSPVSSIRMERHDLVWSSRCIADASTGRTHMIHLNFNPQALNNTFPDNDPAGCRQRGYNDFDQHRADVEAVVHELTHAIGFRTDAFSRRGYLSADGTTYTRGSLFVRSYKSRLSKSTTEVQTPRVAEATRAFFGCASSAGMEIEDYTSGDASGAFHWEARVGIDDLMAKDKLAIRSFWSDMTTAFFADTGHFTARTDNSQLDLVMDAMKYGTAEVGFRSHGRGRGCSFTTSRCVSNGVPPAESAFCFTTQADDNSTQFCTHDRLARGYCGAVTRSGSIPSSMSYYALSTQGGLFESPDYCPVKLPYGDKSCVNGGNADEFNVFGNVYGRNSRCFDSNAVITGFTSASQGARCFDTRCIPAASGYTVVVASVSFVCTSPADDGRAVDLSALDSRLSGTVTCAPYAEICGGQNARDTRTEQSIYGGFTAEGIPALALDGATARFPSAPPVANAFTSETQCEHRLVDCFAPLLDAAFATGDCGAIARGFANCFTNDCIDTRRTLLAQSGQMAGQGSGGAARTIRSFRANCSNAAALQTMCPGSGAAELYAYCNLDTRPSPAAGRGIVIAVASAFAFVIWGISQ
eukprot:CAMPEP_0174856806 /NCGR_PEP_ID=MMETSP1114-20130205/36226_1 /TAXON_ID=312471 /ORGANISM="Neobodo designis, Strain CCAP 1951/1" /LENGTH=812 /DNA_ID=CAMNT_0016091611 /DNA_START=201 /DNA_END=2639 /DNA_ORIENTATION=+